MVIKVYDGHPERRPAPKTSEYVPAREPQKYLVRDTIKPPLVFPGVKLPSPTTSDQIWKGKFDKYANCKKRRKCATMLRHAIEEKQLWRIAYALEKRHQDSDPDSVFTICNDFSFASSDTLDDFLVWLPTATDIKEMIINGFHPQQRSFVDFHTMTDFHRDTLMTWAEHAKEDLLNKIFLVTIRAGQKEDISKLSEMGADIDCKFQRSSEDPFTPLRCAINRQDNEILQQVIDLGANIFAEFDELMGLAYQKGNLDIVKTLKEAREAQEKSAGLQSNPQTSSADGWTALSATFAEYSRPKGATGLQLTYQFDFEAGVVSCAYEKDNAVSAPTIISLSRLDNPELIQKAADVIEKNGYPRPNIEQALNTTSNRGTVKTITAAAPRKPSR